MDPVTGFGLTVGVLQLVDYSIKFFKTASEWSQSSTTVPIELERMEVTASDLINLIDMIATGHGSNDGALMAICNPLRQEARQLLEVTKGVECTHRRRREIFLRTLKALRASKKAKEIQDKPSNLRTRLITYELVESREDQTQIKLYLKSMSENITSIGEKLECLIAPPAQSVLHGAACSSERCPEVCSYVTEKPSTAPPLPSLQNDSTMGQVVTILETTSPATSTSSAGRTPLASPATTHNVIQIRSPSSFRCGDAGCACSCHLGQYIKTPLFMRALLGAVSFRETCENHSSKLWEMKYWLPRWIANYNVYLLFERSACGTPSFGLRFQRKVPWGNEDTITRFLYKGDSDGVRSILANRRGQLDDIEPNHGLTGLHYAVLRNHVELYEALLNAGADEFIEDDENRSSVTIAWERIFRRAGTPAVLEKLQTLFPADDFDSWGFGPLHKAVLGLDGLNLSQILSAEKLDVNTRNSRQRSALHWAALRGDETAVRALLDAKADVDSVDLWNCTPLSYAARTDNSEVVKTLMLRRANVNHVDSRGESALHVAARHEGGRPSVKVLVDFGADINRQNNMRNTPFKAAAINNVTATGRYLLKNGADRYIKNIYADTALRETIQHNCHEFLTMLLEDEIHYDDINNRGSSLLHTLALEGDVKTIQILKTAPRIGLVSQLKNRNGETALEVCMKRTNEPKGFKEAFLDFISTLTEA